jgi:ElaB/YqjD/DUF883 family membrane-anchored ribosome-binding protein
MASDSYCDNTEVSSQRPSQDPDPDDQGSGSPHEGFRDRFESLIPMIQKRWPDVASQTLEATRGSVDELAHVISEQTGRTATAVKSQLLELLEVAGDQGHRLGESLEPLERQLESLLDELNSTLRPRLEKPVRERPLLALGLAAGVGMLLGVLLTSGRRSS